MADQHDFQKCVAETVKKMGLIPAHISPRNPDGSFPVVARPDPLHTPTQDDFLQAMPTNSRWESHDPDVKGQAWNICRDFVDVHADELEEWLQKSQHTAEDVESLCWLNVGMDGVGADTLVSAWGMARQWFDANQQEKMRASFESIITRVSSEARTLYQRLSEPTTEDPIMHPCDEIFGFQVAVVEPCHTSLRHCSLVLSERFPPPGKSRGKQGGGDEKDWKPNPATRHVITLMKQGLSNDTIAARADVKVKKTVENLRQIRKPATDAGLLPPAKRGQRDAP